MLSEEEDAPAPLRGRIVSGLTDAEVGQIVETISQAWPVDRICIFGSRVQGD